MNRLDLYFRAFTDYRKLTKENSESAHLRAAILGGSLEPDKIVSTQYIVSVDSDWVDALEKGLVYVAKAVKEERQFIRRNGEVVPIEKAKAVSRASVEHLARHSNYISHVPEEGSSDDLIPDKILLVEKLSDYAVYENRFLYALLLFLNDFIAVRLNQITDLANKYLAHTSIKKDVTFGKRHLVYTVDFDETSRDDPYRQADQSTQAVIDRILAEQHEVTMLLNTPLMKEVAKAPLVHAPITKTNVLKMNPNFKASLVLWDFVTSYNKKGYGVQERPSVISPFPELVGDEFAELLALTSFLTYENANGLREELLKRYQEEEKRRQKEEQQKLADRIKLLKKRLKEEGITPEEYIGLLEKRINDLEANLVEKDEEIRILNEKHEAEMEALKQSHLAEIVALKEAQAQALKDLAGDYEAKLAAQKADYESQLATQKADYEEQLLAAAKAKDDLAAAKNHEIEELEKSEAQKDQAIATSEAALAQEKSDRATEKEQLIYEKRLAEAELQALQNDKGKIKRGEFTSKDRFEELERERDAFNRFFNAEWKAAKAKIREETYAKAKEERTKRKSK